MDYRDLSNLLMKLAGAFIIASVITNIPIYSLQYISFKDQSFIEFTVMTIAYMLLPLLLGVIMFYFPRTITNRIIKGGSESMIDSISIEAVEYVAIGILGLLLLVQSLTFLLPFFVSIVFMAIQQGGIKLEDNFSQPVFLASVFRLVFAVYLLLGAKGVQNMLKKIRAF